MSHAITIRHFAAGKGSRRPHPNLLNLIESALATPLLITVSKRHKNICCMSIQNLNTFDPFADAIKGDDEGAQEGLIHIRIQQRNGRKTLTTVQGISNDYDKKKIVKACKKEFACNGTVVQHPEYGEVLQLQGDQRENICQFLTKMSIAKPEQLKVHGF
uniref:Eukaryotic translation initiation factor eIF1 n=1 Tax=Strigamia maritima TaxID=126957 RepID=T1INP3_STRMM